MSTILQITKKGRMKGMELENLPIGVNPPDSGFSIVQSTSVKTGELAGVGQQQCPGLSYAGFQLPPLNGHEKPSERRSSTPHRRATMAKTFLTYEDHPIDEATMKLGLAESILMALHDQHSYLDEKPSLSQADLSNLIYATLQLVEAAHQIVGSMDYRANMPESRRRAA